MTGNSKGFDRRRRLLKAADYKQVFDGAEFKVSHSHMLILARRSAIDHPRVGLVIAKKNIRLAVTRNRVKRLIRESFRHQQADLGGLDIVVLARKGLGEQENRIISDLLNRLWQKLQKKSVQAHPCEAKKKTC
ncbi:ribonuclease P protein component [Aestuariirhabdus litorea]|uniref:Ribonuclease P protein component n=1 Tax=Aestuariirhabdus litorea TaxID=2528527 RepID=A0A3P3VRR2_9GAMM|nr:ribonuclease P protein component [Aestuariirhabdus litorea]RWW93659.1 ribonuclease P protein component [Endozoicomonadaceae bacterium GTF-13]